MHISQKNIEGELIYMLISLKNIEGELMYIHISQKNAEGELMLLNICYGISYTSMIGPIETMIWVTAMAPSAHVHKFGAQ